jgi:hypothetical protein
VDHTLDTTGGDRLLLRRIRLGTGAFLLALVASGATALPIRTEFDLGARFLGKDFRGGGAVPEPVAEWFAEVHRGLSSQAGLLAYGTDWLAFGHFAIALAFVGALRDPVRNRWLFQFGLVVCALVFPWALGFGALRGIPWWWRAVDCSFGLFGSLPLWACHTWVTRLEKSGSANASRRNPKIGP